MGNKQLTILIGGREALPVRAIPYVTGWQRFSPDFIANNLAQNFKQIWCDESAGLTAYHLSDGIPIAAHPREWDAIVVNLKSFEAKLQQENSNDDIGYAAWRAGAVSLLPSDAFVWLDEFKEKYQADKESLLYFEMKPSNAELILTPLLDANTRAIVLEGILAKLKNKLAELNQQYDNPPAAKGEAETGTGQSGDDEEEQAPENIRHDATLAALLNPLPVKVGRGITKKDVMAAFQNLKWDYDHWGKNLASPPEWLIECRVAKGSRSKKASALWNPVLIAIALLDKKIPIIKLDTVFVNLKDWADEWRESSEVFRY